MPLQKVYRDVIYKIILHEKKGKWKFKEHQACTINFTNMTLAYSVAEILILCILLINKGGLSSGWTFSCAFKILPLENLSSNFYTEKKLI